MKKIERVSLKISRGFSILKHRKRRLINFAVISLITRYKLIRRIVRFSEIVLLNLKIERKLYGNKEDKREYILY